MSDEIEQFNEQADARLRLPSGIAGIDAELPPLTNQPDALPEPDEQAISDDSSGESSDTTDQGLNTASRIRSALSYSEGRARYAYDRIASLPTPGGSGVLLTAILLILFAAVPVSKQGKTRLNLVWDTVRGLTFLEGRRSPVDSSGASQQTQNGQSDLTPAEIAYGMQRIPIDLGDL